MKKIDLETWNRKEHFYWFKEFEEPFFGIVTDVDVTRAYSMAKDQKVSFFAYYLHKSLAIANQIKPFKYRIVNDEVFELKQVHASATIARKDQTFGLSFIEFDPSLSVFKDRVKKEVNRIEATPGMALNTEANPEEMIHYTSIPWFKMSAFSHARKLGPGDSCPKIAFGQLHDQGKKKMMPLAIHVHHALMDGVHVAQYVSSFQTALNG